MFVGQEEIKATSTHPFWVEGKGWVAAGELQAGDKVRLYNGSVVAVDKTTEEKLDEAMKVYNFEVEDWHTYYVSGNKILVHNMCSIDKVARNTVDDLIQGVKETTKRKGGVVRNFEKTGGFSQTVVDFNNLNPTNVKEIQTKFGTGYYGTLADGTSVVARPGSTTGGATLEIKISNSKVYKIRY